MVNLFPSFNKCSLSTYCGTLLVVKATAVKKNNVIINAMRTSKGIAAFGGNQSLVAQMVKRLPVMWETWVRSLGWEDPLEKEMATHSSTGVHWISCCYQEL